MNKLPPRLYVHKHYIQPKNFPIYPRRSNFRPASEWLEDAKLSTGLTTHTSLNCKVMGTQAGRWLNDVRIVFDANPMYSTPRGERPRAG